MLKSIVGWLYNLVKTDWGMFWKSCANVDSKPKTFTALDAIWSALIYETTPQEYFFFEFYNKNSNERSKWAGQTAMWRAQRTFVPKSIIKNFADKENFSFLYKDFMKSDYKIFVLPNQYTEMENFLLKNLDKNYFLKPLNGQCGVGAFKLLSNESFDDRKKTIQDKLNNIKTSYIVEDLLVNHPDLKKVNDTSLNTIRLVTQVDDSGKVNILFARVRFGVGKDVDNLGSGGLAAPVDIESGTICGEAVSTLGGHTSYYDRHPISNIIFDGLKIPNWDEAIELVKKAALVQPQARVIGWDVAITIEGVYILEGNHNWCKLLWQLPVKQGLKQQLKLY